MNSLTTMLRDENGATLVEYALVLALVAVAAIAGLHSVYDAVSATLNNVSTSLSATQSGS
ncbi:MAG TPA: Flp family type IVb pilin [Candidatus Elarobacter sp.]|jgi:pilus assembly protein Flp/PilA